MKRFLSGALCVLMLLVLLPGSALAAGSAYNLNESGLVPRELVLSDRSAALNGVPDTPEYAYIWLQIKNQDETGDSLYSEIVQPDGNGTASFSSIGLKAGRYVLKLLSGQERYSSYHPFLSITVDWDGKTGSFPKSPVYDSNQTQLDRESSSAAALAYFLRPTKNVQSDHETIQNLAAEITAGCASDFDKTLAIHNWVCDNIYYDYDAYRGYTEHGDSSALGTLESRRSVCAGYANLTAALLRAAGIPAKTVSGYALGISTDGDNFPQEIIDGTGGKSNHAWNMAFVDGRWVSLDTTWDSGNKWENGQITEDKGCDSYTYFMVAPDRLARDHAIMNSYVYSEIQLFIGYNKYWDAHEWHDLSGTPPYLENGAAMIPIRSVVEAMGGTVDYDDTGSSHRPKITCEVGGHNVQLWLGYDTYYADGNKLQFQYPPKVVGDTAMVHIRALLEAMDCTITWDTKGWEKGRITVGFVS